MAEAREVFPTIDAIHVDYHLDEKHLTRQIDKIVLGQRGAWALIMFLVETLVGHEYRPKVMIHRYRKQGGGWRKTAAVKMDPKHLLAAADHLRSQMTTCD